MRTQTPSPDVPAAIANLIKQMAKLAELAASGGFWGVLRIAHGKLAPKTEQIRVTPRIQNSFDLSSLESARRWLDRFDGARTEDKRRIFLPRAAVSAVMLDQRARARTLAESALALAAERPDDIVAPEAFHLGHTVLGMLALRDGDETGAIAELATSATGDPSRSLASGPSMRLAKELLRRGRTAEVLDYFARCRPLWPVGQPYFDIWERKVRAGELPVFLYSSVMP